MASELPLLDPGSRRRVLIYQPSCASCASTELDSPRESDADSVVAVASSTASEPEVVVVPSSGVGESVVSAVQPPRQNGRGTDRSRSPAVALQGRAPSSLALALSGGPIRVVSPGRLLVLPVREEEEEEEEEEAAGREGVGASRGELQGIQVPGGGVSGVQLQGVGVWWGGSEEEELGTQLMNGTPSDIVVDVRPEPRPILESGDVGWGFSEESELLVSPGQWISSMTARALVPTAAMAGSSAAGFLLAHALRDVVAPAAFPPLLTLTYEGGETLQELVRQGVEECGRQIRSIVDAGQAFYVGITENPPRRWDEHRHTRGTSWECMTVLVQAPSSAATKPIEQELLERWGGKFLCHNVGKGGERASAGMPHFVYVLAGPPLLRRSAARRDVA